MRKVLTLFLTLLFNMGMVCSDIQANEVVFSSPEIEKTMELVNQLEDHGYDRSAIHYLKEILRNENLKIGERQFLEARLGKAKARMSQAETKVLPNLEVMIHFDRPAPSLQNNEVTIEEKLADTTPEPHSFPSNRINKKKWFLVATAVVVTGVIAYKVTKHLRPKNGRPPNMVTIRF